MKFPFPLVALLASSLVLAACSSSSSSESPSGDNGQDQSADPSEFRVSGPLDAAQEPMSEEVFGPMAEGAEGTPLAPVVECTNQAITFGALDIADAALVSLEAGADSMDPQSALMDGADNIQAAAEQFVFDLQNLFAAFTDGECRTGPAEGGDGPGFPEGNPFAGTPLEPLGDALAPVFEQFPDGGDGDNGQPSDLGALSDFFTALNQAFQDGLSQVPPEALEAPVVGGVFATLSDTLNDLDALVLAVSLFDSPGTTAATQQLVESLLVNALTEIVPIRFLEEQGGMEGEFSGQIEAGAAQLAEAFGELEALFDPLFNDLLNDALQPLIGPIGDQVLPAILGPLTEALAGGGGNGGEGGPTGTPLDEVIAALQEAFDGSGGLEGTPLGDVLSELEDAFGGDFDLIGAIEDALGPLQGGLQ